MFTYLVSSLKLWICSVSIGDPPLQSSHGLPLFVVYAQCKSFALRLGKIVADTIQRLPLSPFRGADGEHVFYLVGVLSRYILTLHEISRQQFIRRWQILFAWFKFLSLSLYFGPSLMGLILLIFAPTTLPKPTPQHPHFIPSTALAIDWYFRLYRPNSKFTIQLQSCLY